jgi:hypothetical protein
VPATVTVAAGATSVTFKATATPVATAQSVTITAQQGSASNAITLAVPASVPTLSLTSSSLAPVYGSTVVFKGTISSGPTGSLTFYDNGSAIGTAAISGTSASLSTSALLAGSHSISARWAGNSSYAAATSSALALTVSKATPVITWKTPASIFYGTALSSTQLNATSATPGSFTYSPAAASIPSAGVDTLSVTFTPTDSRDYATVSQTVNLTVKTVVPTLTWSSPAAITYGTALSSTQLNATASVPGTFSYSPAAGAVLTAGKQPLSVTFTPTDAKDYTSATRAVSVNVTQVTPVVTWAAPASISYGTALSSAQLNATASVPGTFTYTPAAGTVLTAGTQKLTAVFTPTDTTDYASVKSSTTLSVAKVTPVITWNTPASIIYGTPLSSTQLNAVANVPGTFAYSQVAGTVMSVGTQTLRVSFTPTDTTDYAKANGSTTLTVVAGTPALSFSASSIAFGNTSLNTTATQSLTLTSSGTAPVTVNSASVWGAGFSVSSSSFPVTLAAGQTLTIPVQFSPLLTGASVGQLTITSTATANSVNIVSLNGYSQVATVPMGSVFTPPAQNACQSSYDQFYGNEPGVYAYWALCENAAANQFYDYVGSFDLTTASKAWGTGTVQGGAAGPVEDGETAATVSTALYVIENQNIPLNTNQGTIATWINTDATPYSVSTLLFSSVNGKSAVSINVNAGTGLCFSGNFTNAAGTQASAQKCGYVANTWHRVALTWNAGQLDLFVDGASVATASYSGNLDNSVFFYRFFPGCCDTGKQMTMAKALISNQAWSTTQVSSDYAPVLATVPTGGVYVSSVEMGEIHRNVLGYGDFNQNISTPALRKALISGMTAAGLASARYAGGYGGIQADLENWLGGVTCTQTLGSTAAANNVESNDSVDNYLPGVVQPLNLDVVFTVNYGSNPPQCDAGGDPAANGASLVEHANAVHNYGIKYWEIGNEVFSSNTEPDFHANPHSGSSYAANEPLFYAAMKAKDPSIKIGVPIGLNNYGYQTNFDLPVLANASYDAVIYHNYPMVDPITDGDTLYTDRVASSLRRTRSALLKLQTELLNAGKSPDSIWITEWNGEVSGDMWSRQSTGAVAPMFVATQLAEYMQAGVQLATWWAQGNGNGCSILNYDANGDTAYNWWKCGSASLVYAGPSTGAGEQPVGLQPGDLTPAGRGFQILSESGFVTEGEHMVQTRNDAVNAPWLQSFAATHAGSYAVILINRDRDSAHTVPVSVAGKTSGGTVKMWSYGRQQYDATAAGNWSVAPVTSTLGAWSNSLNVVLPPWSVNVLVFSE